MQSGADSLKKSYFTKVRRDYEIPRECVGKFEQLALKIFIPFVHAMTFKDGKCECETLVDWD